MLYKLIKHFIFAVIVLLILSIRTNKIAFADIGYNFSTKEFINTNDKSKKKESENTKNNEIVNQFKISVSGMTGIGFLYSGESGIYSNRVLPAGYPNSGAMAQSHIDSSNNASNFDYYGYFSIMPEYVRYKTQIDKYEKPEVLVKIGIKFTLPFQNAIINIDPRMMTEEYGYIDTKYFRIEGGATFSVVSKMRVDPSSVASGSGGVYGAWWKYVKLPTFNTSGLSPMDAMVLNAMSPVFILYPTLPNESGFTNQSYSVGRQINSSFFNGGNVSSNNLIFGSRGQGYSSPEQSSNKISIYSKRFYGLRGGFSYAPTTGNAGLITRAINGNVPTLNNISGGDVRNYTSFAVDYRKQFDKYGIGVALFFGYEYGEPTDIKYNYNNNGNVAVVAVSSSTPYYKRHNLNAFAIGSKFVWKNISVAYSYGYWGKSLLNKYKQTTNGDYQVANQGDNSYYHSVGVGFNYGQFRAGITYMRSNFAGNKLDAWSIGLDYKSINLKYLNITPYVEYVGYHFHNYKHELIVGSGQYYSTIGNNGFVIQMGCKATF